MLTEDWLAESETAHKRDRPVFRPCFTPIVQGCRFRDGEAAANQLQVKLVYKRTADDDGTRYGKDDLHQDSIGLRDH